MGEVAIVGFRVGTFELDHAREETEEEGLGEILRSDAFAPQFVQKRPIAAVDRTADTSQVLEPVVGGDAVDVVNSLACWDSFAAPCAIDSS